MPRSAGSAAPRFAIVADIATLRVPSVVPEVEVAVFVLLVLSTSAAALMFWLRIGT